MKNKTFKNITKAALSKKIPYIIILLLAPIIVIIGTIPKNIDLFNALFNSLDWYWFYILYTLANFYMYFVTFDIFSNKNISIRYKNKIEVYLKTVKYSITFSIIYSIILFALITIMSLLITKNVIIESYNNYTILNIVYYLFYIIKIGLITNLISLIGILLRYSYNKNISIIYISAITISCFIYPVQESTILNILNMNFHPFKYFQISNYGTFIFEVLIFMLYISILNIIVSFLYKNCEEIEE